MTDKPTETNRAKLESCLKGLQTQHAKMAEQIAEFEAFLAEGNTPGQAAKKWLTAFGGAWLDRYRGEKFVVSNWPKDMAIAKRLLAQLDHEELLARARRYLADRDPFYLNARHPLGLFATNVNKYGTAEAHDEEFLQAPPMGCTHRPLCKSDAAHTQRVNRELRA